MKILIIGGNRFFGKKLTKRLIEQNHEVTLLNRGTSDDGFGDKIERLRCDRTQPQELKESLEGSNWDLVYDQVCYDYTQAKEICEVLKGKTKRLIFTSSQSVYEAGENIKESSFDPKEHQCNSLISKNSDYAEAKRQAEASFEKHASFPVVHVRFPIVIGLDDYTRRFQFHIDRIKQGREIYFPSLESQISFVTSDFAAESLAFLAGLNVEGPLNIASPSPITLHRLIEIIEERTGQKAKLATLESKDNHSPYCISKSWYMNCDKLHSLGLKAHEIEEWLPLLI